MRDGARRSPSLLRSVGSSGESLAPAAVRRNGESCVVSWLERVGLNRSGVTVWASAGIPVSAVSATQGNSARKAPARLDRPLAGPAITIKILQRIHLLGRRAPNRGGKRR